MEVTGTVTNHSSKTSTYILHFDFVDSNGLRVTDAVGLVNEVQPGQTANFDAQGFQANPTPGLQCKLTKVDRNGF